MCIICVGMSLMWYLMYVGMRGVCVCMVLSQLVGILLSTGTTCAIIMSAYNFEECPCSLFPCLLTLQ